MELVQIPVWMTTPFDLDTKYHVSIIMAFKASHMQETLSRCSIYICNTICRLGRYLTQHTYTQYHKCQQYRHHMDLCNESTPPACGHRSEEHLTNEHPYSICSGGYKYTNKPLYSLRCKEPHRPYVLWLSLYHPCFRPFGVSAGE